jgi:hypothetical protein
MLLRINERSCYFARIVNDRQLSPQTAPKPPLPLSLLRGALGILVVHDRDDDDTYWTEGAALAEAWPGAQLLTTTGLGHRRILRVNRIGEG